jgi:NAD(P)-dependent dehydrogenase (short-subunit alcohol dehydrogenase family)
MRVLIIGASGLIGRAIVGELGGRHELVTAGRNSGDLRLDITDPASIKAMYEHAGALDAVVSAAGKVKFAPLADLTGADFDLGLRDKLMGQVNIVLIGQHYITDGGSFTLTTGVLDHDPIPMGSSASLVNGAVNAFVLAAAIELRRGLRINAVSPGVIKEALAHYGPFFRGFEAVPVAKAARAYAKSVEGAQTGQVYRVL